MVIPRGSRFFLLAIVVAATVPAADLAAQELVKDGSFEAIKDGDDLRRDDDGQDWYESRKDKRGTGLLILSTKAVAGNATQKAMLKADPELNTYLSQRLDPALGGRFTVRYAICVKEIRREYDRSAFFLCGTSNDKKNGPNSTGKERFVFLGFENGDVEGKINLFAREADTDWEQRTLLAGGLDLMTWYTVTVDVDVTAGTYTVRVGDGPASAPLRAFRVKKEAPVQEITHVSFATWNDGAGTFYVDNVSVVPR